METVFEAANNGDLEMLRRHVEAEGTEARDNYGSTALMLAAKHGHLACVTFLIDVKSNINATLAPLH